MNLENMGTRRIAKHFSYDLADIIQAKFLYLVKRLYRTRNVDFKSMLTMSSGRAFGFGKPTSCISSNEKATLWTWKSRSK